ncbi:helix-turn-helix domain-containing protein [Enterococcus sp. LJL98]
MTPKYQESISSEVRREALMRMLPPNKESVAKISRELNIPETTLFRWCKEEGGELFLEVASESEKKF